MLSVRLLTNRFFFKSRLSVNCVTVGDYERPLIISKHVKDLSAGFQVLNLKNDMLRKRYIEKKERIIIVC